MKAFGDFKDELGTPLNTIGHIHGVAIGAQFNGKGELAILGIHSNITAGIYSKCATQNEPSLLMSAGLWCLLCCPILLMRSAQLNVSPVHMSSTPLEEGFPHQSLYSACCMICAERESLALL
jgi:hypothetical protein